MPPAHGFQTVLGRNLVGELRHFVHRPFLVVTMEDLWPGFAEAFEGAECEPYFVRSVDEDELVRDLAALPDFAAVVGLGGGMAIDTAKYFAWRRRCPLFQVQTALSMNAGWGHRAGIRSNGVVRYVGWAVPEAVYIDLDVIRAAPRALNLSGIGDILCAHTGVLDWKYAADRGRCEPKWPFEPALAAEAQAVVDTVLAHLDDIRDLTDTGIRILVEGLSRGTSYHTNGWNPRPIEGIDHFFFYALEHGTRRKFIHGPPVCLGIAIGSLLHRSRAEEMLRAFHHVGLDIRPEAMGVTWDDVARALAGLRGFVRDAGLWHSIAHDVEIGPDFVRDLRHRIEALYGPWAPATR